LLSALASGLLSVLLSESLDELSLFLLLVDVVDRERLLSVL